MCIACSANGFAQGDRPRGEENIQEFEPSKTAGKGVRLSAAYYYYEVCGGKISLCTPQAILQPDGRTKLKEIRIVNGVSGPQPRWVLVA